MADASNSPASNREMPHRKANKKRLHCWVSLECYLRLNEMAVSLGTRDRPAPIGRAVEQMCVDEKKWAERGDMAARILKSSLPEEDKLEAMKPIIGVQGAT